MMRRILLLSLLLAGLTGPARAWDQIGHETLTIAAVKSLPADVPAFFRRGAGMAAHFSLDPDVLKNRAAPALYDRESPDHWMDYELVEGMTLPPTRSKFEEMCVQRKIAPRSVGFVPYTITEDTERLAIAFAEYRKWPDNPYVRTKCIVYAGLLAHYAEDVCQPLHTTIHHDGLVTPDKPSPHTGVHARVDALIDVLKPDAAGLTKGQVPQPIQPLFQGVVEEMLASHKLVDRVYELDAHRPAAGAWARMPEVTAFTMERAREATRFTASLYLTAWQLSAEVRLPGWLQREAEKKR